MTGVTLVKMTAGDYWGHRRESLSLVITRKVNAAKENGALEKDCRCILGSMVYISSSYSVFVQMT